MGNHTLGKHEKIRRSKDYINIYQRGVRTHSRHFTVVVCNREEAVSRLGMTVSKKVGNAVKRNRIKRLLREFFRLNKSRLAAFRDIVIIVKRNLPPLSYHDVSRELEALLIKKTDV